MLVIRSRFVQSYLPRHGSALHFVTSQSCICSLPARTEAFEGVQANETEEEGGAEAEEECGAEFKPLVELQEVETVSGEEEENLVVEL